MTLPALKSWAASGVNEAKRQAREDYQVGPRHFIDGPSTTEHTPDKQMLSKVEEAASRRAKAQLLGRSANTTQHSPEHF